MSDHESNADWKAMVDLQMYNVQEEQALMNVVPILGQLKERYEGIDTSGLVSFLHNIDEINRAREAAIQQYISATLGKDAAKELKSKAAYFAEDSPERLSPPNTLPGGASSDGSQLPREQLFQESNQKKRSSDISLEGETDHQRKRARAATPEGEVAQLDQEEEHDEEQRRRQQEIGEAEQQEREEASLMEAEQQRLANERIEREKEVARIQQEKDDEEQRRLQREKEELEQQEMAAKEQQRLADQQRDRIEREKEEARVQQQEAEERRRLQREKEEFERQEMAVKEAKVKVALHFQCCYRCLVARNEAAKAKKAKRDRLARERRKKSKEKKSYTDLIERSDKAIRLDEDETPTLTAGKTPLIADLADTVDLMSEGKIIDLKEVIKNLTCLIGPNFDANSVIASRQSSSASRTAAVFKRSSNVTIGSLLNSCDDSDDALVGEGDSDEAMKRLKLAFEQYNKTVDPSKRDKRLKKFFQLGRPARNIVQHLLNLLLVGELIDGIKLMEVVAHLPSEVADELIRRATELASLVDSNIPFDIDNITVGSYTNTYVHPGLKEDHTWELATSVVVGIFDCFTGSVGMTKDQKRTFKQNVDPHFQRSQNCKISGGRDESGVDFFGGSSEKHMKRRKKAVRTYLMVLLKKAMLRMFPRGLFDKCGGYTQSILRLSPSDMVDKFSFVKDSFFGDDNDVSEDVLNKMKSFLNKQKQSDGEITLLIENVDQINSLKRLLACWRNATSSEGGNGTDETSDVVEEDEESGEE